MSRHSRADSLSSTVPFKEIEERWYRTWEENGYFRAGVHSASSPSNPKPFVMSIPPPNITGRLHMGHALNNTIQDFLVRFHRMDGCDVLWVPGTDHAGIATQTVVKKQLDAEGIDYKSLQREDFLAKIWEWKEKYGHLIVEQLKRLGCSCDWSRLRFTMDEDRSLATKTAFKALFDDGLIYKGKRMVNWCPVDQTALSDDEVEVDPGGVDGFLWHIRYPIVGSEKSLVVATTRPETMFGDVAVAIHPDDERYQELSATHVQLPFTAKTIPIVRDAFVDKTFGSGCVKVTPAHDPNDYDVGLRHGFEPINTMNPNASMNDQVPLAFRGLSREKCRQKVLAELKKANLLEKEEPKKIAAGRSYRSKAIVEYRLSDQWFVSMKPMATRALKHMDELNLFPKKWKKVYKDWLDNIQDWCISRQITWGHRIPAWTNVRDPSKILVDVDTPEEAKQHPDNWKQEEDVLDTWFSSALWPMSTLGWPNPSADDFVRYFPTSSLSTAKDILFFWVARMNMMSLYFKGTLPYKDVYFHATVMDSEGKVMSKSKGNGIDPIHVIEGASKDALKAPLFEARPSDMERRLKAIDRAHPNGFDGVGADALRYTLLYLTSSGQEFHLSMDDFLQLGRRFVTKLWNAGRFVLSHIEAFEPSHDAADAPSAASTKKPWDEHDWMFLRLRETAKAIRGALQSYDFSKLGNLYYTLVWNDFCDWTIEFVKRPLADATLDQAERKYILSSLSKNFDGLLRLLHPVVPFITEELWQHLRRLSIEKGFWAPESTPEHLMVAPFPAGLEGELTHEEQVLRERFEHIKFIVSSIRHIKQAYPISPRRPPLKVEARLAKNSPYERYKEDFEPNIKFIERLERVNFLFENNPSSSWGGNGLKLYFFQVVDLSMHVKDSIEDLEATRNTFQNRIEKLGKELDSLRKRLNNPDFESKADPSVVQATKDREFVLSGDLHNLKSFAKDLD